jgi:hypothetical protein
MICFEKNAYFWHCFFNIKIIDAMQSQSIGYKKKSLQNNYTLQAYLIFTL